MASALRDDGDYGVAGLLRYLGHFVVGERLEVGGLVDSVQYAGVHSTTSVYKTRRGRQRGILADARTASAYGRPCVASCQMRVVFVGGLGAPTDMGRPKRTVVK